MLDSIRPTSVISLNQVISHAELPKDFFEFMQYPDNRNAARLSIVNGDWFSPTERENIIVLLGLNNELELNTQCFTDNYESGRVIKGRDVRFRFQILPMYHFSCCLCGIKQLLPSGATLVEAAHIQPFSHSRNDDITNGIALCRNHHWSFDQGLWTIGDNFEITVAHGHFMDEAPNQQKLSDFHKTNIDFSWLPVIHRPAQQYLNWHSRHCFIAR